MGILQIIAIIFFITAIGGYINNKFIKLPNSIGILLFSVLLSIVLLFLQKLKFFNITGMPSFVNQINFEDFLLHGILSVLLFAGALHIDISDLKAYKYSIFSFSTFGVILATFIIGALLFFCSHTVGIDLTFVQCLLFGSLISSTDAVTVLSVLEKHPVSVGLKTKIIGESLFNDATSVALFLTFLGLAFSPQNIQDISISHVTIHMVKEMIGGAFLGFIFAWICNYLLATINADDIAIIITIALAIGSYAIAEELAVSAPIASVVAGLYIGNKARMHGMSEKIRQTLDTFWTLLDEVLNAVLFVLMGLILVLVDFNQKIIVLSLLSIFIMLIGRYFSILGAGVFLIPLGFDIKKVPILMTWGGLRGGISIALALSIPNFEHRQSLLAMTYVAVVFSILVQGTTLGFLLKKIKTN